MDEETRREDDRTPNDNERTEPRNEMSGRQNIHIPAGTTSAIQTGKPSSREVGIRE
jgi:hypothetical protein